MPPVARIRLAESVAAVLREQIIAGKLADGDRLPSLERLSSEYQVGAPSIREALRILENEGLITVQRGNVGGAVVHRPTPEAVAYVLSLVLRSSQIFAQDLVDALTALEATCAASCAQRVDRAEHVLPGLRHAHEASGALVDGPGTVFAQAMATFHRTIAASCGNRTLTLLTDILERLWEAQAEAWFSHADDTVGWPPMELRLRGLEYHSRVIEAIERGDAQGAAATMTELASHPMNYGPAVGFRPLQHPDTRFTGRLYSAKSLESPDGHDRPTAR